MTTPETDTKLESFISAIVSEAVEESQDIARELRIRESDLIAKAEIEIAAEMERYKTVEITKIKAAERKRVNARMTENKLRQLQYREACAKEVFGDVKKQINAFTASDKYLPHLQRLLKQATDILGYGVSAEVLLRREDMHFAEALLDSAYGVSLAFSAGSFTLGGLCVNCPAKGKRVDMTFDAALGDMVGHFTELSGLLADNQPAKML